MINDCIIVIPAFNEENTIEKVILNSKVYGDVVIINDGSSDNTIKISKKHDVNIVNHKINQGYEASIFSGFQFAKNNKYKYVIFIDADGELPDQTLKKVKRLLLDGHDIVTGIRDKKNRNLEMIFSFISLLFWRVNDPMCGLKGFNIENISNLSNKFTNNTFATEILFKLLKMKYSIIQFPIIVNKRENNSKVGNSIKVQFIILKAIFLCIWIKFF